MRNSREHLKYTIPLFILAIALLYYYLNVDSTTENNLGTSQDYNVTHINLINCDNESNSNGTSRVTVYKLPLPSNFKFVSNDGSLDFTVNSNGPRPAKDYTDDDFLLKHVSIDPGGLEYSPNPGPNATVFYAETIDLDTATPKLHIAPPSCNSNESGQLQLEIADLSTCKAPQWDHASISIAYSSLDGTNFQVGSFIYFAPKSLPGIFIKDTTTGQLYIYDTTQGLLAINAPYIASNENLEPSNTLIIPNGIPDSNNTFTLQRTDNDILKITRTCNTYDIEVEPVCDDHPTDELC